MRAELVVGAGAALLIGALAGVEWWAEHQWVAADAVVRPADGLEAALPESIEVDGPEALASPRLSR
ncbi:MAG: hypothetical protein FJZ38_24690 [Candidatus Rokubacteria bacterium]|nr:hypothetical protein [Candidatus Rokubacteria bacterium]